MGLSEKSCIIEKLDYKAPKKYSVIMYNDDFTSMDFVIGVLVHIFHKSHDEAMKIMLEIHKRGDSNLPSLIISTASRLDATTSPILKVTLLIISKLVIKV